jgi:hypothetical protein
MAAPQRVQVMAEFVVTVIAFENNNISPLADPYADS